MKNRWMLPIALVVFAACGGDSDERADQKEFEVVQEGSASGVTSTIAGPGEALPPITGTNADTTTAFTIDPNAVSAAPAPGTIAGTLPPPSYPSQPAYIPPSSPSPSYTPPRAPEERPMTSSTPAPEPAPQQTPATDTAATQQQQPPQQTQTAPPPPTAQPKEQEEEEPEEAEEEPPPPPTTTDTRGQ